jgi:hypothetical protein
MLPKVLFAATLLAASNRAVGHADPWTQKFGELGDLGFSGIPSFAHLNHTRCLDNPDVALDIAILGVPFDTAGRATLLHFLYSDVRLNAPQCLSGQV